MSKKIKNDTTLAALNAVKAEIMLKCIVEIARIGAPYSFFLSKMIWALANYCQSGNFSRESMRTWSRASIAAEAIRRDETKSWEWRRKQLTFEHARPIADIYRLMVERGECLTMEAAQAILAEYPPVVVTKEENAAILKGMKKTGVPEQRYAHIPLTFPLQSGGAKFCIVCQTKRGSRPL